MDDPALNVSYETIARFFEAAEGNYRNAVYVTCSSSCQRAEGCRDFLLFPAVTAGRSSSLFRMPPLLSAPRLTLPTVQEP